jgi:hypothetical protein
MSAGAAKASGQAKRDTTTSLACSHSSLAWSAPASAMTSLMSGRGVEVGDHRSIRSLTLLTDANEHASLLVHNSRHKKVPCAAMDVREMAAWRTASRRLWGSPLKAARMWSAGFARCR